MVTRGAEESWTNHDYDSYEIISIRRWCWFLLLLLESTWINQHESSVSLHRNSFKDVTDTETGRISLHRTGKNIIDLDVNSVLRKRKEERTFVWLVHDSFFSRKKNGTRTTRWGVRWRISPTWIEGTLCGASAANGARAIRRRGSALRPTSLIYIMSSFLVGPSVVLFCWFWHPW